MKPLFLAILACALCLAGGTAQAALSVSPLRQVVSNETRSVVYRVSNPSSRIIDGRVQWSDMIATETGYAPAGAEDRSRLSAAPYLSVRPARFRLEPGAHTEIVVSLREGVEAPAGERRSHLVIESEAVRTPHRKAGGGLEVDIGVGVSTPVILRGGGDAAAAFGETRLLRMPDGSLALETFVTPAGDHSAYGAVEVRFTPEGQTSNSERLAIVENVAGYIDAPRRRVSAPLRTNKLPKGVLEIRFAGREEFEGRTFAVRNFQIAPPR